MKKLLTVSNPSLSSLLSPDKASNDHNTCIHLTLPLPLSLSLSLSQSLSLSYSRSLCHCQTLELYPYSPSLSFEYLLLLLLLPFSSSSFRNFSHLLIKLKCREGFHISHSHHSDTQCRKVFSYCCHRMEHILQ